MSKRIHTVWLLIALAIIPLAARAQETPTAEPLIILTKEAPPFSFKDIDGRWDGLCIVLWREIADELGVVFQFRETDIAGLINGMVDGSADMAAAALTVNAEREALLDFSHPFHDAGLGIAVNARGESDGWTHVLTRIGSVSFLQALGGLALVLGLVGFLVWLFERRDNGDQFGGGLLKGIGSGFWFSAVTMTTVGYGDKVPRSVGGRLVALVWMFTSLVLISSFTAALTTALTVPQLETRIENVHDLARVRVGAVGDSAPASWLTRNHIAYRTRETLKEALADLAAGRLDAVVHDAPLLQFHIQSDFPETLSVLDQEFSRDDYAFAFPSGSPLREQVNRILVRRIREPSWREEVHRFLGAFDR